MDGERLGSWSRWRGAASTASRRVPGCDDDGTRGPPCSGERSSLGCRRRRRAARWASSRVQEMLSARARPVTARSAVCDLCGHAPPPLSLLGKQSCVPRYIAVAAPQRKPLSQASIVKSQLVLTQLSHRQRVYATRIAPSLCQRASEARPKCKIRAAPHASVTRFPDLGGSAPSRTASQKQ